MPLEMSTSDFTPKLVTVLREGYRRAQFKADALAGLTVAIVALPLSMAIAIASHATPAAGLYAAIIGGFCVSAFGGSRYQIGGPAGAFIVLVASTIDTHGFDGLLIATMMAGAMMLVLGALRLGQLARLVPHPVVIGFSAGIAAIIFASQLKDLLGLHLHNAEPAAIIPKLKLLWQDALTFSWPAIAISAIAVLAIIAVRKWRPGWPAFLIAVVLCTAAAQGVSVETIGSRYGGIPSSLPIPALPAITYDRIITLLPVALSIALLGSIESLLSAIVADNMKGRQHRSNAELVAQGLANIATPLFGGITVTGTIARTATNVRAGAFGPISGIMHAVFLLLFMLVAAPLASYIPLAALAGILVVVAWNMAEKHAISLLLQHWPSTLVFAVTLLLTVFRDLTEAILAGTALYYAMRWFLPPDATAEKP